MYCPKKVRDVTFIKINEEEALVIACDSAGGVGAKPEDVVKVPGWVVGSFLCRAPLMEVLATGATPVTVVDTLSVEMNPSGMEILEGVRFAAREAGLDPDQVVTGSTEDTIPVKQTGIGVVVVGVVHPASFRPGKAAVGDKIVCFGIPKVGEEVGRGGYDDPETAGIPLVLALRENPHIHDLLPVGSRGIAFEAGEMCRSAGKTLYLYPCNNLDLQKPAGPSTCLLAAVSGQYVEAVLAGFSVPRHVIGEVRP